MPVSPFVVPVIDWGSFPRSDVLKYIACHGQSRVRVVCCECQCEQDFYLWSMAGHGVGKCKGCGVAISYHGYHTVPADLYNEVHKDRKKKITKTT